MHPADRSRHSLGAARSPQGLAVTVRSAPCLSVEPSVRVFVRVLAGEAWVTANGRPRDTIADPGAIIVLEPGTRFTFTAFREEATMLFTASRRRRDIDFSLRTREGMRRLTIAPGGTRLQAALSRGAAAIATFARHRLALLPPGTF